MSRIESGRMELAKEPFSLGTMLDNIDAMIFPEAQKRGLTLKTKRDLQNDVLVGDAIRLRQVIINLLSNAVKFTPSGGEIVAIIREDASTERDATYTIRVTDSGMGIHVEDQERIFKSFEQAGGNASKSQGTGLGLAISHHIVELMGGELKVQSEVGKGSTFYFTVTLPKGKLPEATESETSDAEMLQGVQILVAEDNDLNAEIVKELLSMQGAVVTRAENGKVVVEMFQASVPGFFRLILMDVLMPEMNGRDAARAIRSLSRPDAGTIPIIAMTANAFQEDVDAAKAAGMTGFLSKPIDAAHLYEKLLCAMSDGK